MSLDNFIPELWSSIPGKLPQPGCPDRPDEPRSTRRTVLEVEFTSGIVDVKVKSYRPVFSPLLPAAANAHDRARHHR